MVNINNTREEIEVSLYSDYREKYGSIVEYLDVDCIVIDKNKVVTDKGILEFKTSEIVEDYKNRWLFTAHKRGGEYIRAINIDTETIRDIECGVIGISDNSFLIVDKEEHWKLKLTDSQFNVIYTIDTTSTYERIRGCTNGDKDIYTCVKSDNLGYLDVEYNVKSGEITVTEGYDA